MNYLEKLRSTLKRRRRTSWPASGSPDSLRVGDWLFVPEEPPTENAPTLHNVPLAADSAAPAPTVDELLCSRGEPVWHHPLFAPIGIDSATFSRQSRAVQTDPRWSRRTRLIPQAPRYARGNVRSAEGSVQLSSWHRVSACE
jgi:hypothetical protein